MRRLPEPRVLLEWGFLALGLFLVIRYDLVIDAALSWTTLAAQTQHVMVPAGPPAGRKLIWILGGDGRLSAYDSTDFHLWKSVSPLPPDALAHPENISIGPGGLVLYANGEANSGQPLFWNLWSNGNVRKLMGVVRDERPAKDGSILVTRATPVARLSADGQHIFWFETRLSVVQREGMGDVSQAGEFLSWTSGLDGRDLKPLVSIALPPCKCATGACEETCPVIGAWAPSSGVSDFFFLTRWVPGQTSPDFLETDLYQAANSAWKASKLREPVAADGFLDAADHGASYISAIPDAGCCGWENESDNVTDLVRDGKKAVLFDEFGRFHNKDYDVSFFTPKALFSPDATQIAYGISTTSKPGREIRLADEGKSNPEELRQIRDALTDLPRVEVVRLSDVSKPRFSLTNAELVGWLDSQCLLVWQRGQLFVVNTETGQSKAAGLKAENAGRAFIR